MQRPRLIDARRLLGLAVLMIGNACGCESPGGVDDGSGSGGAGESSSVADAESSAESSSTGVTCGEAFGLPPCAPCGAEIGGPTCKLDSPCDPEHDACNEGGVYYCSEYSPGDCMKVEPRCVQSALECAMWGVEWACTCRGVPAPADCAEATDGIASSPELCATDATFACDAETCRTWLEVCVAPEDGEAHCESPADLGCEQYGLADCSCLEVESPEDCIVSDDQGAVRIVTRTP